MIEVVCKFIEPKAPVGGFDVAPLGSLWRERIEGIDKPLLFAMSPNGKYCLDQIGVTNATEVFDSKVITIITPRAIEGWCATWTIRQGVMLIDQIKPLYTMLARTGDESPGRSDWIERSGGGKKITSPVIPTPAFLLGEHAYGVPSPGHFLGVERFPYQSVIISSAMGGSMGMGVKVPTMIARFDGKGAYELIEEYEARPLGIYDLPALYTETDSEDEDKDE